MNYKRFRKITNARVRTIPQFIWLSYKAFIFIAL